MGESVVPVGRSTSLAVIIPVLNEADQLPSLLDALRLQQHIDLHLIVSDGGSSDDTPARARAAGATVIAAPRGRGAQMNAGARSTASDYLLFLHADSGIHDSRLLMDALARSQAVIEEIGHDRVAGHFPLRFERSTRANSLAYRYMEEKTYLNRPFTTNGDQGFLLSRRYFEELEGFDETLPFLEDQRLAEKIRASGRWITLPGMLTTSARRFEAEGFHRRLLMMAILMGLHYAGVQEFFERAPQVYRAQHEANKLLLMPFFRLIRQIMVERGVRSSGQAWLRVGRFVKQNAWQCFFFLDVVAQWIFGYKRRLATAMHDRVLGPLLTFRVWDVVMAILVFVGVMGVLQSIFWLRERS